MAYQHIYPVSDLFEHECEGGQCWCEPEVQWLDPETGLPWESGDVLVIHHAADGRELTEPSK